VERKRGQDTFLADSLLLISILEAYYERDFSKAISLCNAAHDEIVVKDFGGGYELSLASLRGRILLKNKQYPDAKDVFAYLAHEEPRTIFLYLHAECCYHEKEYLKAKTSLLKAGRCGDLRFDNGWYSLDYGYAYPRKFYLLGKVNEALGENEEAISAYKQFLEIWKEADKDLPELIEAKERLATLTKR
jgi:tetratricopeptide (TPR) repeat protein